MVLLEKHKNKITTPENGRNDPSGETCTQQRQQKKRE